MGLNYLFHSYMPECDKWILADNSSPPFAIVAEGSKKGLQIRDMQKYTRIRALVTDTEDRPTPIESVTEQIVKEMAKAPQAHDGVPYQKEDQP